MIEISEWPINELINVVALLGLMFIDTRESSEILEEGIISAIFNAPTSPIGFLSSMSFVTG
mgnify:CR=1 FL=1